MESQKLYMASISMETISHCHGKLVHFEKKIGPFGKSVRNEAAKKKRNTVLTVSFGRKSKFKCQQESQKSKGDSRMMEGGHFEISV